MAAPPIEQWTPVPGAPRPPPPHEAPDEEGPLAYNWFSRHEWMRRGRRDLKPLTGGKALALGVVGIALLLLGSGLVYSAVLFLQGAEPEGIAGVDLAANAVLNLLLLAVPPLVWVAAFYKGGIRASAHRLLLRSDHVPRDIGIGIAAGIVLVLLGILVALMLEAAGAPTDNPVVEALGPELTWPLIVLISISAGVSEEIFFRGFLQGRIGIVPANVLFGVVHLDYGTPIQVFLPMVLGVGFSWLALRTRSLWPAIIAHAVFDLIMLGLTKLSADNGWAALGV